MSRGGIGPARKAARPASTACPKARHRDRIVRLGDCGVEQDAVNPKLDSRPPRATATRGPRHDSAGYRGKGRAWRAGRRRC